MNDDRFGPAAAPPRVGQVSLRVRNLEVVAHFYQRVLGLSVIAKGPPGSRSVAEASRS